MPDALRPWELNRRNKEALRFILDMAGKDADNDSMCKLFSCAIEQFPRYYRLLEEVLQHLIDLERGVSNPIGD